MSEQKSVGIDHIARQNFQLQSKPHGDLAGQILRAAHAKILKSNTSAVLMSGREKEIDEKANKEVEKIRSRVIDPRNFDRIVQQAIDFGIPGQIKVISYPMPESGSSEDQIDPTFPTVDQIIPFVTSDGEVYSAYLACEIKGEKGSNVQLTISRVKGPKLDEQPQITFSKQLGNYSIYTITVSTFIRQCKISLLKDKSSIHQCHINLRSDCPIILQSGISYDLKLATNTGLSILEEIIVLSLFNKMQQDVLFPLLKKHKKAMINQPFYKLDKMKKAIEKSCSLSLFYKTVLELLQGNILKGSTKNDPFARIYDSTDIFDASQPSETNLLKIYKLLALAVAVTEKDTPLSRKLQKEIYSRIQEFCVHLSVNYNLKAPEIISKEMFSQTLLALIDNMAGSKQVQKLRRLLEQAAMQRTLLFKAVFEQYKQFEQKVINRVHSTPLQKLELVLKGFYYYYCVQPITNRKTINEFIRVFSQFTHHTNISQSDFDESLSYWQHSLEMIVGVLFKDNMMVDSRQLVKYLKIVQYLNRNSKVQNILSTDEHKQFVINSYKSIPKKSKFSEQRYILLRQLVTKPKLGFLYPFKFSDLYMRSTDYTTTQQFARKECDEIFRTSPSGLEKESIKLLNRQLALPLIEHGLLDEESYTKFLRNLKWPKQAIFQIIGCGLTDQFLHKCEQAYDKILNKLIKNFCKLENKQEMRDSFMKFKMHCYINQKILSKYLENKSQLAGYAQEKYQDVKSFIQHSAPADQKQTLLVFLMASSLEINERSIFQKLMEKNKIWLKILNNLKQKDKSNQMQRVLQEIKMKIDRGDYSFEESVLILPSNETDISNLKHLITEEIYNNLITRRNFIKVEIQRKQAINKFIATMHEKYKTDSKSCREKIAAIKQECEQMKKAQVNTLFQRNQEFSNLLLNTYKYSFFHQDIKLANVDTKEMVKRCDERVNKIVRRFCQFMNLYHHQSKLDYFQHEYFGVSQIDQKTIESIIEEGKKLKILVDNPQVYHKQIKQFEKTIQQILINGKLFNTFKVFLEQDDNINLSANEFTNILNIFKKCNSNSPSKPQHRDQLAISLPEVKQFNTKVHTIMHQLSLEDTDNIINYEILMSIDKNKPIKDGEIGKVSHLLSLAMIVSNTQIINKLVKLEGSLGEMKQLLFELTYIQKIQIEINDIDRCGEVISFIKREIQGKKRDKQFVKNLIQVLEAESDKFIESLWYVVTNYSQFEMCMQLTQNSGEMENSYVKNLLNNSLIYIHISSDKYQIEVKILQREENGVSQLVSKEQLSRCKDEAAIYINKWEEDQSMKKEQSRLPNTQESSMVAVHQQVQGYAHEMIPASEFQRLVKKTSRKTSHAHSMTGEKSNKQQSFYEKAHMFLHLCDLIEQIQETEQKLLAAGFMVFYNYEKQIGVSDSDVSRVDGYLESRLQQLEQWKNNTDTLNLLSEKATILKRRKMLEFYLFLTSQKKDNQRLIHAYRIIERNEKVFKKFFSEPRPRSHNITEAFGTVKKFFELVESEKKHSNKAKDHNECYFEIFQFPAQNFDYAHALGKLSPEKRERLSEAQILNCSQGVTFSALQSFVDRIICNSDNQYVILGYESMTLEHQNYLIDRIRQTIDGNSNRAKICLVGNSSNERIYRYAISQYCKNRFEKQSEIQRNKQGYKKFMQHKINGENGYGKVQVYSSARPGLGKTYQIQKSLMLINKKPIYFPISGRTSCQQLEQRFKQVQGTMAQRPQLYGLVIQLYNVQEPNIVNDFLRSVIMWRSYNYQAEFYCISLQTPIYIEYQLPKQQYKLPFLQLQNLFPEAFHHIQNFSLDHLQLEPTQKLNYVIEHLNLFDIKTNQNCTKLDETTIESFHGYKSEPLDKEKVRQLIKKYFFDLSQKYCLPTYYQFHYWVDIIFESCKAFSSSFVLRIDTLKDLYGKFWDRFEIFRLRSAFFQELVTNSVHFLCYSIRDNLIQATNPRKLSFIMIPDAQHNWFCFVYRKLEDIPKVVRTFLISQDSLGQLKEITQEVQQRIFKQHELQKLEHQDNEGFQSKMCEILRGISGNSTYDLRSKQNEKYAMTMDNFEKMCIIAYRMRVNLPMVIQGEAGIGKTALLEHLIVNVFRWVFIKITINAGLTESEIQSIMQSSKNAWERIKAQNYYEQSDYCSPELNTKVCLFLDEFNTSPELGYIKQIIMENRFMGQQKDFMKNIITFAACNPRKQLNQQNPQLAYKVFKMPLAINQVLWDFGSLTKTMMQKYMQIMLQQIKTTNNNNQQYVQAIISTQDYLNSEENNSISLRDVERMRILYRWFCDNLPEEHTNILLPQTVQIHYSNKYLRAYILSFYYTYVIRYNSETKRQRILQIPEKKIIPSKEFMAIKQFEQQDFCSRLKNEFQGIVMNRSLKQNLYCCFVAIQNRLPVILIGQPGCSKTLAARILVENFKTKRVNGGTAAHGIDDQWLKRFNSIAQFQIQGSKNCQTVSIQRLFDKVHKYNESKRKNQIAFIVFEEISLAEQSKNNPLKALHEPLEVSPKEKDRKFAFLAISNSPLDVSKMSRCLVIRRPNPSDEEFKMTALTISDSILSQKKIERGKVEADILKLVQSLIQFTNQWRQKAGINQHMKNFYGLRDFYNLIKCFVEEVAKYPSNEICREVIDKAVKISVFRNFNGYKDALQLFFRYYFGADNIQMPSDVFEQVLQCLKESSKRFPLIIVPNAISYSIFNGIIRFRLRNTESFTGSCFQEDTQNNQYIIKSLSNMIKHAESETLLIASNLNSTVETALYDLFNKFFIRRRNADIFRVSMESGCLFSPKVNSKFNCVIIIEESQLSNVQSAFLNRFQKYDFVSDYLESEQFNNIMKCVNRFIQQIVQCCKDNQMQHYKLHYLFMNCSQICRKTIIWRSLYENPSYSDKQHELEAIKKICLACTKDFEEIFRLFIVQNNNYLSAEYINLIRTTFEQKCELMDNALSSTILTSDREIFGQNSDEKVTRIVLDVVKSEGELQSQITDYFKKPQKQVLEICFFRKDGCNVCDPQSCRKLNNSSGKQSKDVINVQYIIQVVEKRRRMSALKDKPNGNKKKVRLFLLHSRIDSFQLLPQITHFSAYPIFSFEGETKNSKATALEGILIGPLIKIIFGQKVVTKYSQEFGIEQDERNQKQQLDKTLYKFATEDTIFASLCRESMKLLQGNNIEISDQDIIAKLKEPANLTSFKNFANCISLSCLQSKFDEAIIAFIQLLIEEGMLMNTNRYILIFFLSRFYKIDWLKQCEMSKFIPEADDRYKGFVRKLAIKKLDLMRMRYRERKRRNQKSESRDKKSINIKLPSFFPHSEKIIDAVFGSQELHSLAKQLLKEQQPENFSRKKQQLIDNVKTKINAALKDKNIEILYHNQSDSWKHMIYLDFVIKFLQDHQISTEYAVYHTEFLNSYLSGESLQYKIILLMSHPEAFVQIFKIYELKYDAGISLIVNKNQRKPSPKIEMNVYIPELMRAVIDRIHSHFKLTEKSVKSIRVDDSQEKQVSFIKYYLSIVQEVYTILNLGIINENQNETVRIMIFESDFIRLWSTLCEKQGFQSLDNFLSQINNSPRILDKISCVFEYIQQIKDIYPHSNKLIDEYLGNKLFYSWLQNADETRKCTIVNKIAQLSESSEHFTHNITRCIDMLLRILNIDFKKDFQYNLQRVKMVKNYEHLKLFASKVENLTSNMSILLCAIFYRQMWRCKWIIGNSTNQNIVEKLKDHIQIFKQVKDGLKNLGSKLGVQRVYCIAYCKLYLYHFIECSQLQPDAEILMIIDQYLSEEENMSKQLRFYCMKLLRRKIPVKQIHDRYIQMNKLKMCKYYKQIIKESKSRLLYIPHLQTTVNKNMDNLIVSFISSDGKESDKIVQIITAAKNGKERYMVMNLFMKYLYTLSYNKIYSESIKKCVADNKQKIIDSLGPDENRLIQRYVSASFDKLLYTQSYETFNEDQFIVFNVVNWLLATKSSQSPLHQIFIDDNGRIRQSYAIYDKLNQSFLPSGRENPFISIAKVIAKETSNRNIGVYICGRQCDYIYTHMNCGWPSQKHKCEMCGKDIGSARGHKLARVDEGARRVLTDKFVDNWHSYVSSSDVKKLDEFWEAQKVYVEAEINRMRTKSTAQYYDKRAKKNQLINLRGYCLEIFNERVSIITSKILSSVIECILYWMVSMDYIVEPELGMLFESSQKEVVLKNQYNKVMGLIKEIKETINVQGKCYSWIFGVHEILFSDVLFNFKKEFETYVESKIKDEKGLAQRTQNKSKSISNKFHQLVYQSIALELEAGLSTKYIKQVQENGNLTFQSQFIREVIEQSMQKHIQKHLYDDKLVFISQNEATLGKPQFQIDSFLIQNEIDTNKYSLYSRILKTPVKQMPPEQILDKNEIIIKEDYPFLNYLLKNQSEFNTLNAFYVVIEFVNMLMKKCEHRMTRKQAKSISLAQFFADERDKVKMFLDCWRKIDLVMGSVQVDCKVFGTMNNQVTEQSPIIEFLLETSLKQNACGSIIAGIFHNYASKHNEVMISMDSRKNQISKYRNINYFLSNLKISPQQITKKKSIYITEDNVNQNMAQLSIDSIIYQENTLFHNFDACEFNLLNKVKGICQLEKQLKNYTNVRFVGECFGLDAPEAIATSIVDLREDLHEEMTEQQITAVKEAIKLYRNKHRSQMFQLKGSLEQFILTIYKKNNFASLKEMKIQDFIYDNEMGLEQCRELGKDIKMGSLVTLYELLEYEMHDLTLECYDDRYTAKIPAKVREQLIEHFKTLPREPAPRDVLTLQKFRLGLIRIGDRSCLSGFFDSEEKKIFENLSNKYDVWDTELDVFTCFLRMYEWPELLDLRARNICDLDSLLKQLIEA